MSGATLTTTQRDNERVAELIRLVASDDATPEQVEELKVIGRNPSHAISLYEQHVSWYPTDDDQSSLTYH